MLPGMARNPTTWLRQKEQRFKAGMGDRKRLLPAVTSFVLVNF